MTYQKPYVPFYDDAALLKHAQDLDMAYASAAAYDRAHAPKPDHEAVDDPMTELRKAALNRGQP
jgi:hypothetical protein